MYTKEELEEVWRSGPIGWLKKTNKEMKGKSQYTITAKPYRKQYLDPVEMTVWAKDAQSAMKNHQWNLSNKVREKYPHDEYKDIAWEYGYKKHIKE